MPSSLIVQSVTVKEQVPSGDVSIFVLSVGRNKTPLRYLKCILRNFSFKIIWLLQTLCNQQFKIIKKKHFSNSLNSALIKFKLKYFSNTYHLISGFGEPVTVQLKINEPPRSIHLSTKPFVNIGSSPSFLTSSLTFLIVNKQAVFVVPKLVIIVINFLLNDKKKPFKFKMKVNSCS